MKPGDEFFDYADGGWYSRTEIPADLSEVGLEQETGEKVESQLRSLIVQCARDPKDADEQRIGALYNSYVNERLVNDLGSRPIKRDLETIGAVHDRAGFARLLGKSWSGFGADVFLLLVQPDPHLAINSLAIGQAGLELPSRDDYVAASMSSERVRYAAYIARTLRMAGVVNTDSAASSILKFEARIAKVSWTPAEQRELDKTSSAMTVAALKRYAPGLDWRSYLEAARIPPLNHVVVAEKSAVRDIAAIIAQTPLTTLKAWETFHTVDNASPFLSRPFVENSFRFHSALMSGAMEMRPREELAISQVNSSLGDAIGRKYVSVHLPPRSEARIIAMVAELKHAMAGRIERASWMSPGTRAEALNKLAQMKVFVGYPSRWRNYAGLHLSPVDLYGNIRRTIAFNWAYQTARLGRPVDPNEWGPLYWGIHPQTVDAFNIASENKIIFPAALLQPPEFDPDADPAVNFGGIGAVIGHEISHGFDDQGRKIDASGTLRDWWSPDDAVHYRVEADKLVKQVDAYEILPGVHINGRQTLGENIADLAGLLVALDAYHSSLGGKQPPVIDGFSGDQRVFLAWGQKWRRKNRDDSLRAHAATDTHSPARFRAIGAVRNIDAWYRAFDVQPGDQYYLKPEQRARIW